MPRLFNQGQRTITYDKDQKTGIDKTIEPKKAALVSAEQAKELKRLFPTELINLDDQADLEINAVGKNVSVNDLAPNSGTVGAQDAGAAVDPNTTVNPIKSAANTGTSASLTPAQAAAAQQSGNASAPDDAAAGTAPADGEYVPTAHTDEGKQALIAKLDGMDKADLAAHIDENDLDVDHASIKNVDKLKGAVLKAQIAKDTEAAAAQ